MKWIIISSKLTNAWLRIVFQRKKKCAGKTRKKKCVSFLSQYGDSNSYTKRVQNIQAQAEKRIKQITAK